MGDGDGKKGLESVDAKVSAVVPARLPQVDKVLRHPIVEEVLPDYRRDIVVRAIRETLERLRSCGKSADADLVAAASVDRLNHLRQPALRKVINGTGVVLNTNLGRAPISSAHLQSLLNVASGYCNLEINLDTGKRGKRSSQLEDLLRLISGAEGSLAVNNNAAAIVLAVNCFAAGKEVIVSRGELIEIGGSFRLPDVIEAAGGKLREVGTTNKTRLADFERAIGPQTGLVMRCHRSNFELKGFTEQVNLEELVELCAKKQVPLLEDLGSGVLVELRELGLEAEPTLEEVIRSGCDMVAFSGDKLLGGPQAGLISGKKAFTDKLSMHPLYRALRLDKITISLLEQALAAYLHARPQELLPSLSLISAGKDEIKRRAEAFAERARHKLTLIALELTDTNSAIGGGALPGKEKPSAGLVVKTPWKAAQLSQYLRQCEPPVVSITRDDETIIDFRTVSAGEEDLLLSAILGLESKLRRP